MSYATRRKPWRSDPPRELEDESLAAKRKTVYFAILVVTVFGILTVQLARLQLIDGAFYRERAETNRLRKLPLLPTRGLIFDRNGLPLVENRASYAAGVVAADVPEGRQIEISIALQELLGVPAGDIEKQIDARRISNDPFTPEIVNDNLTPEVAFALREQLARLPGVRVVVEPRREYTQGPVLSHILGFVGRIDAEEHASLASAGYQLNDYLGKTGVELSYEALLRGRPGERDVVTDASGRELRLLEERPARAGSNLVLTIDADLQRKVTEFVQAGMGASTKAAAVVIDVKTGEVLALVSIPSYDNNVFTGRVDEAVWQRLQTDPAKPMVNHAIAENFPPGSTFKQVTGLAALQEGIAHASTVIFSPGVIYVQNQYDPRIRYPFRDWAALGSLNFYRGVAMSSDVYFYYLAGGYSENGRELFQGLGATRLADWSRRFGLGSQTGIDLPGEADGIIPDPLWKERTVGEPWTLGDTYNFGIGQGYVATTPLQMAIVTAAVANGGDVLVPRVVREVREADGRVLPLNRPTVRRNLNIDPRNMAIMREGMRQAVVDGTARTAAVAGLTMAGKTGTAEFGERRPDGRHREHGWFTGYAPYNQPEIAVSVFLEQGGGALTAAPVARKILEYYFSRRGLTQGATR